MKFWCDFISLTTLYQPFVHSHDAKTKPPIFFTNTLYLGIGEISANRSAYEKLRAKFYNTMQFFDTVDVRQIDAAKITNVTVIAAVWCKRVIGRHFSTGVAQCFITLVKKVERKTRFGCTQCLFDVAFEYVANITGAPVIQQPVVVVVHRDVCHVHRCWPVEV